MLADWVMSTLDDLAAKAPFGDGRVQLGLAFDGFFLPKEMVVSLFDKVKALGIKSHHNPLWTKCNSRSGTSFHSLNKPLT
jgi:hypothetical protein